MFDKVYVIVKESDYSWDIENIVKVCIDKRRAEAIAKNIDGDCKIIEVSFDKVQFCNEECCKKKSHIPEPPKNRLVTEGNWL